MHELNTEKPSLIVVLGAPSNVPFRWRNWFRLDSASAVALFLFTSFLLLSISDDLPNQKHLY